MKKILIFIFGILLFSSCEESKRKDAISERTEKNEYLNINSCKYYKIKIGNHDVYQYKFQTKYDDGSDIIHFTDMCNYCITNHK